MNTILKIENLSKQYRLGLVGTGTMADDLKRWWYTVRGKEDPFLKIGDVNDRSTKGTSAYVWALQNINFEVQKGEVLGIIGKNGAGKSTLLKILSKITSPTTGSVKSRGRIASLLEVGTGFHGEMTGRENIYLNGAILGMTKKEITAKFEEIVEFSGCERYIDTPVKRYSSGMTVRLAFAVAAFLEPDILIIDEVLAVGDAEFQKKAIGKMQDISKGEGRTVLFVSHNMAAVKSLCTRGIVLENGGIVFDGDVDESVEYYLCNENKNNKTHVILNENSFDNSINLIEAKISSSIGKIINVESGIDIFIRLRNNKRNATLTASIIVLTVDDIRLFEAPCFFAPNLDSKEGVYDLKGSIPPYLLNTGSYKLMFVVGESQKYVLYIKNDLIFFDIEDTTFNKGNNLNKPNGFLRPNVKWEVSYVRQIN